MARAGKKKIGTLEIVAAILAVIFIFSIVGILNAGSIIKTGETQRAEQPEAVTETAEEQAIEIVVEEQAETQSSAQPAGTRLTSAESGFEVRTPSGSGY